MFFIIFGQGASLGGSRNPSGTVPRGTRAKEGLGQDTHDFGTEPLEAQLNWGDKCLRAFKLIACNLA